MQSLCIIYTIILRWSCNLFQLLVQNAHFLQSASSFAQLLVLFVELALL